MMALRMNTNEKKRVDVADHENEEAVSATLRLQVYLPRLSSRLVSVWSI